MLMGSSEHNCLFALTLYKPWPFFSRPHFYCTHLPQCKQSVFVLHVLHGVVVSKTTRGCLGEIHYISPDYRYTLI